MLQPDRYTSDRGRALGQKYQGALRDLNAKIYHCMPWLDVKPEGAIVDLDGRLLGLSSLLEGTQALRRIPVGRHTLRISMSGYRTAERDFEVTASRPTELKIALERE